MKIEITERTTLGQISNMFRGYFPYLQLRFYKRPIGWSGEQYLQFQLNDDLEYKTIRKVGQLLIVELNEYELTIDFENRIKTELGLNIQLYRKYKDRWIRSEGSDILTISQQNALGESDASP
jgi:hypothetical protein